MKRDLDLAIARIDQAIHESPIYNPAAPLDIARDLIARGWHVDGQRTIHRAAGTFYRWMGSHYAETPDADIRASIYDALENAQRVVRSKDDGDVLVPFRPARSSVDNVADALRAAANLPGDAHTRTCWLDGRATPDPKEVVAVKNGLLYMPTREVMPHDPRFFTLSALPFAFDSKAPDPRAWLDFLASVWPNNSEAIDTLQRFMGYLLSADTSHQKMLLLVGPKRSGKGTIARVITSLLGRHNVAGPTLSDFSRPFGLAQLIGRRAAIIGDARLSGRADQGEVTERLLSITGEDTLTVDRKHREPWIGTLPARVVILTNELPRLQDASGALASRFLILTMQRSFYGVEDRTLGARIEQELPGVLRWALDGWDALQREGRFTMPQSSSDALVELEELSSPVNAFVRDKCRVKPGAFIDAENLFTAWKRWCERQGRDHPGTSQTFGRDLRAAVPGVETKQYRATDGERRRKFEGIGLRDDNRPF